VTFKEALKGREPVLYVRASTKEQKGTLKTQEAVLRDWLKRNGITRKPRVEAEQVSGTTMQPPGLLRAVGYCAERPGKTFLLVRDYQRFSRNWRYGGANMIPLYESDTPVVSALKNQISSTAKTIRDEDWLIGLFMAVGAQEVDQLKKRTQTGVAEARKAGILRGTNKDFYSKEALNPYRELVRLLGEGIGQNEGARRLGRSTAWWRKNRDFLALIRERGGDELLDAWLDSSDRIREIEQRFNFGKAAKEKKILRAVRRMTSGWVQEPYNFTQPTEDDFTEYITNFKEYQPKRSK